MVTSCNADIYYELKNLRIIKQKLCVEGEAKKEKREKQTQET